MWDDVAVVVNPHLWRFFCFCAPPPSGLVLLEFDQVVEGGRGLPLEHGSPLDEVCFLVSFSFYGDHLGDVKRLRHPRFPKVVLRQVLIQPHAILPRELLPIVWISEDPL